MKIILDDTLSPSNLYPFTNTKHPADIRIGILTIREKWQMLTGLPVTTHSGTGQRAFNANNEYLLPANLLPSKSWINKYGLRTIADQLSAGKTPPGDYKLLQQPWHLFELNGWALQQDFELLTTKRESAQLSLTNRVLGTNPIFLETGAVMEHAIINTTGGPVYLGKNTTVMEGAMIRGPFALCEGGMVKMGAAIYGATSVGPYCIAGGEIKNSIMMDHSNKSHDGYLGDSVIGSWCNLGAGTTNSNLKNTAGEVKVFDGTAGTNISAGLKCGLLMGDYSRTAIQTRFNTGTVVGTCCHVFGDQVPPKNIPNFTWGEERYTFEKAMKDINNWKMLKHQQLTPEEMAILKHLYTQ